MDKPDNGWVEFLTKKRYKIYLPSIGSDGNDENGTLDVTIKATNINLSNLEGGVGLAVLSYPVAYGYYQYESWLEEKEMKERKAKIAAKNAAKAGAAKKAKGTPNKESKVVKAEDGTKPPPLKGQATKKDGSGEKSSPAKKATTAKPEKASIEDQVAAEMLDSQRANIVAATVKQQSELQVAAEMLDSQRANIVAATAKQISESKNSAPGGGYLENLSNITPMDTTAIPQRMGATGYLDSLAQKTQPKRGAPKNYLDSL